MPRMRTLLLLSLVLVGCSDDKTNNTPVDAAPPTPDAPALLALDCTTYCTHLAADCKDTNAQISMANCMGTCAAFPPGAATDTSGNTLGCRNYHLQNIEVRQMAAATHCPHAGPVGSLIATGSTAVCGASACADFCAMEAKVCGTDAAQVAGVTNRYTDVNACMTACGGFATTPEASPSVTSGNSFACRIYHLTNAAASTTAANVNLHCGHTLATATGQCI